MTAEYLMKRELEHVYAALMPENRLICRLCCETGLRISDAVGLRTDALKPQFWVVEQKTKKRRRVNLSNSLYQRLLANAGKTWVFPGRNPQKHKTRQAVWQDVKRAAKAFRLPQNVSVHSLRKVYAVDQLKRAKGNIDKVQKLLNHSDKSVTMLYCMAAQIYADKYPDRLAKEG